MPRGRSAPVSITSVASCWMLATLCVYVISVREGSGAAIGRAGRLSNLRFGGTVQGKHIDGENLWRAEVGWSDRKSGVQHSRRGGDSGDLPITIPREKGRDKAIENAKRGNIGMPTISNVKEMVEEGVKVLLVEGSGFKHTAHLQCRMSGFEASGSMTERPQKTTAVIPAIFVSEKLIKCPFSEELHKMNEIVVEVSNDGNHYSSPVVYHPQQSSLTSSVPSVSPLPPRNVPRQNSVGSESTNKGRSPEEKGSEIPRDRGNPKTKTTPPTKGKMGKGDETTGIDKSMGTPKEAPAKSTVGTTSGIHGNEQRHNDPMQSVLAAAKSPHVSGLLAGVMGLMLLGSFYWLWKGRRRIDRVNGVDPDVAYTRVLTSEGEPGAANMKGAGGNNNAFGVYDEEDEQDVGGWGEWDEEWDREEEAGNHGPKAEKDAQTNADAVV